jgi:hypothetical protein
MIEFFQAKACNDIAMFLGSAYGALDERYL